MKWPELRKRDWPLFALLYLLSLLPFPVLYAISTATAWLLHSVIKYRRKVVEENLKRAFPDWRASDLEMVAKAFYLNLSDVIFETLKLASITPAEMRERVNFENSQELTDLISAGSPALVLVSHHTNWEWGLNGAIASMGIKADGIYKPLNSPFFETYTRWMRERLGGHLIRMKEVLRDMLTRKSVPRAIAIVADQTPPKGEIQHWTNFLNQDTAFYVGTEKLYKAFHYPVFFAHTERVKRGHYKIRLIRLDQDLPENGSQYPLTDAYAHELEKLIRSNPSDYLWSHRRWKHQRTAELV